MPLCVNFFLFLSGLATLFTGTYLVRRSIRFQRQGIETPGQVIAISSCPNSEGDMIHSPVIRFTEQATAQEIVFTDGTGYNPLPRRYNIGREVRIRYLPTNPQGAMLVTLLNSAFFGCIYIGVGLFILGFLIANLFFGYQYPSGNNGGFLLPHLPGSNSTGTAFGHLHQPGIVPLPI